jgi:hypothetical protein
VRWVVDVLSHQSCTPLVRIRPAVVILQSPSHKCAYQLRHRGVLSLGQGT